MNVQILSSLLIIGLVTAAVGGATFAYFSDTETSQDNIFRAGTLDLKIDSRASYNGVNVPASTWDDADLTSEQFFNLQDVKPGDYGEATISLHVFDNPAWACLTIDDMHDDDNGCTEPECVKEGGTWEGSICTGSGLSCGLIDGGELAQNLYFFAWADDGDNVFEPGDSEYPLFADPYIGPASDVLNGVTYPLADINGNVLLQNSGPDGSLMNCTTYFIGLAWCAGDMTVDLTNGGISCSGSNLGNEVQSDSLTADISFYVEQHRNNPGFVCPTYTTP